MTLSHLILCGVSDESDANSLELLKKNMKKPVEKPAEHVV